MLPRFITPLYNAKCAYRHNFLTSRFIYVIMSTSHIAIRQTIFSAKVSKLIYFPSLIMPNCLITFIKIHNYMKVSATYENTMPAARVRQCLLYKELFNREMHQGDVSMAVISRCPLSQVWLYFFQIWKLIILIKTNMMSIIFERGALSPKC